MKIGIDCRLWSEAGVGRYIRNLVKNLAEIDHDNEYYLFLLKKNLQQNFPKNFHLIEANVPWYSLAEQTKLPKILQTHKLDLMHFPHFNVPIFYRGKFIVTIHDLIHQHFKMERATTHGPFVYRVKQYAYNQVFSHAVKKSQKVITVSDYVKKQLETEWKVNPNKIVVTKEAAEETILNLAKRMTNDGVNQTLKKFKIQKPYIFYVGNAHPHKNVEGLIKAFLEIVTSRKSLESGSKGKSMTLDPSHLQLVLAGNGHYFWERIQKEYQHPSIVYTGFVTDIELVGLYKGAQCYVVPSFEEGFGIPLLEAFACEVPVVSSKLGSLTEVGAEAAVYFDPHNTHDMAENIMEVINNQKLRKELVQKGNSRFKEFSWRKLAVETLQIYVLANS